MFDFQRTICNLLFVFTLIFVQGATAGPVPGTKISLDAPDGFTASAQFAGFEQRESSASIVVSEIPAPIETLRAGMTKDALATRGVTLLETDIVKVQGRDAILLFLSQDEAGIEFEKWMLLFGDESNSVIILATFPQAASSELRTLLKATVLSTTWDPNKQVGVFEGLPFRVSESKSLKISTRISNTLILTENGQKQMIDTSDPVLVVGTSHSEVELGDLEVFAKHRLAQTPEIKSVVNRVGESIAIDNLTAYELSADAKDSQSGRPIKVYQVIVPDNRNYFIIQGMVGARRAAQFVPQFREVARSLKKHK